MAAHCMFECMNLALGWDCPVRGQCGGLGSAFGLWRLPAGPGGVVVRACALREQRLEIRLVGVCRCCCAEQPVGSRAERHRGGGGLGCPALPVAPLGLLLQLGAPASYTCTLCARACMRPVASLHPSSTRHHHVGHARLPLQLRSGRPALLGRLRAVPTPPGGGGVIHAAGWSALAGHQCCSSGPQLILL